MGAPTWIASRIEGVNWSLFKSWHATLAASLVLALGAWLVLGDGEPGSRDAANAPFRVATGIASLATIVVLALYPVRKYAQRRGYSPELRWEVPVEKLERARSRLQDVENRARSGELRDRARVTQAVREVLSSEGVSRVLRAEVVDAPSERTARSVLRIETRWREPLGRMSAWMHAHIYYGLAAAFLVFFHGGGRSGSLLGHLLNGLSAIVFASGIAGLALWTAGPTWLARRERDVSLEKAAALRGHFARKIAAARKEAEAAAAERWRDLAPRIDALERGGPRYPALAASLVDVLPADPAEARSKLRDLVVLCGQRSRIEQEWRGLARLYLLVHAWRVVHVPAAILLLVLIAIHVVSVVWY
jgi:hypothetical protein